MVLALLLARQGVRVTLLEARENFERDFRGDSVHPSTLELLDDLALLERVRAFQQAGGYDFPIHLPDGSIAREPREPAPSRFPETLNVPQSVFLDVLADAARAFPSFRLEFGARVEQLIEESGVVRGVKYRTNDGWQEVRAPLVVGADGRFSKVRQLAKVDMLTSEQEFDLLWLRLPKAESDPPRAYGLYPKNGEVMVVSDRGEHWQIGIIVSKGAYAELRRQGIESVRGMISRLAPWLSERVTLLEDWSQTSLLVVQAARARRWHRPGLLLIGDAAHVMSPVYGVGINYAIQDAVFAANRLGPRLQNGGVRERDLAAVQRRRELPTRLMQFLQDVEKYREFGNNAPLHMRLAARLVELAPMRKVRTRLVGLGGFRSERVRPVRQAPGASEKNAVRLFWSRMGKMAWYSGE
jgi:2-polyprenyl-6-methoxyphenol hydroxylase-like FAD-dependent oxidoreductase